MAKKLHADDQLYLDQQLIEAARTGNSGDVERRINAGGQPNAVVNGETPLMVAGTPIIATMLIERGASPNALNPQGQTALDIAKDEAIKAVLLKNGAKSGAELGIALTAGLKAVRTAAPDPNSYKVADFRL